MAGQIKIIFSLFALIYCLLFIYIIIHLYIQKLEKENDEKKKEELIELFSKRENAPLEERQKLNQIIITKLKKISYLYAFGTLLEENPILDEDKIIKVLSKNSYNPLFQSLAIAYKKKDPILKAYYAYILHFIRSKTEKNDEFLKECLLTKSIYCTENAISALCTLGDPDKIVEAYLLMTKENNNYGYKLVADGLSNFKGSKEKLCEKLYQNFDSFSEPLRIGILKFFRQCRYDLREELLEKLTNKKLEKEVEIEMIRYFSQISYEPAFLLLLKRLEENYYHDFEYDVVIISTLTNYPSKKTIDVLLMALCSPHYYVRYNAGKSLSHITDLTKLKKIEDPFARDMINALISQEV